MFCTNLIQFEIKPNFGSTAKLFHIAEKFRLSENGTLFTVCYHWIGDIMQDIVIGNTIDG